MTSSCLMMMMKGFMRWMWDQLLYPYSSLLGSDNNFPKNLEICLPDDVGIVHIRKIPTIRTNLLLNHGNIRVSHGDFSFKIVPPSV